jgi:antitoxin HicB
MQYPVTLTRDDNNTIMVTFPDVPEAVTYGDTRVEALKRAPDALLTIFDALMKDRRPIPAPSPIRPGRPAVDVPALESAKIGLYEAMRAAGVNKSELARRLQWHLPQVDRVLNVRHGSQLEQLEAALAVLGQRLVVQVEPVPRVARTRRRRTPSGKARRHRALKAAR